MAAIAPAKPSMNEAHEQDPYNNSCYGSMVDAPYRLVSLPVLDVLDFNERIIRGYEEARPRRSCRPTSRWPARWSPPARRRSATSATSRRRSRCTCRRTAPAAWTA